MEIEELPEGSFQLIWKSHRERCSDTAIEKKIPQWRKYCEVRLSKTLTSAVPLISKLDLNSQELGDQGAASLFRWLLESSMQVEILSLWRNKIGDYGAMALGNFIRQSKSLVEIHMTQNFVGLAGFCSILESLTKNPQLPKVWRCSDGLRFEISPLWIRLGDNRIPDPLQVIKDEGKIFLQVMGESDNVDPYDFFQVCETKTRESLQRRIASCREKARKPLATFLYLQTQRPVGHLAAAPPCARLLERVGKFPQPADAKVAWETYQGGSTCSSSTAVTVTAGRGLHLQGGSSSAALVSSSSRSGTVMAASWGDQQGLTLSGCETTSGSSTIGPSSVANNKASSAMSVRDHAWETKASWRRTPATTEQSSSSSSSSSAGAGVLGSGTSSAAAPGTTTERSRNVNAAESEVSEKPAIVRPKIFRRTQPTHTARFCTLLATPSKQSSAAGGLAPSSGGGGLGSGNNKASSTTEDRESKRAGGNHAQHQPDHQHNQHAGGATGGAAGTATTTSRRVRVVREVDEEGFERVQPRGGWRSLKAPSAAAAFVQEKLKMKAGNQEDSSREASTSGAAADAFLLPSSTSGAAADAGNLAAQEKAAQAGTYNHGVEDHEDSGSARAASTSDMSDEQAKTKICRGDCLEVVPKEILNEGPVVVRTTPADGAAIEHQTPKINIPESSGETKRKRTSSTGEDDLYVYNLLAAGTGRRATEDSVPAADVEEEMTTKILNGVVSTSTSSTSHLGKNNPQFSVAEQLERSAEKNDGTKSTEPQHDQLQFQQEEATFGADCPPPRLSSPKNNTSCTSTPPAAEEGAGIPAADSNQSSGTSTAFEAKASVAAMVVDVEKDSKEAPYNPGSTTSTRAPEDDHILRMTQLQEDLNGVVSTFSSSGVPGASATSNTTNNPAASAATAAACTTTLQPNMIKTTFIHTSDGKIVPSTTTATNNTSSGTAGAGAAHSGGATCISNPITPASATSKTTPSGAVSGSTFATSVFGSCNTNTMSSGGGGGAGADILQSIGLGLPPLKMIPSNNSLTSTSQVVENTDSTSIVASSLLCGNTTNKNASSHVVDASTSHGGRTEQSRDIEDAVSGDKDKKAAFSGDEQIAQGAAAAPSASGLLVPGGTLLAGPPPPTTSAASGHSINLAQMFGCSPAAPGALGSTSTGATPVADSSSNSMQRAVPGTAQPMFPPGDQPQQVAPPNMPPPTLPPVQTTTALSSTNTSTANTPLHTSSVMNPTSVVSVPLNIINGGVTTSTPATVAQLPTGNSNPGSLVFNAAAVGTTSCFTLKAQHFVPSNGAAVGGVGAAATTGNLVAGTPGTASTPAHVVHVNTASTPNAVLGMTSETFLSQQIATAQQQQQQQQRNAANLTSTAGAGCTPGGAGAPSSGAGVGVVPNQQPLASCGTSSTDAGSASATAGGGVPVGSSTSTTTSQNINTPALVGAGVVVPNYNQYNPFVNNSASNTTAASLVTSSSNTTTTSTGAGSCSGQPSQQLRVDYNQYISTGAPSAGGAPAATYGQLSHFGANNMQPLQMPNLVQHQLSSQQMMQLNGMNSYGNVVGVGNNLLSTYNNNGGVEQQQNQMSLSMTNTSGGAGGGHQPQQVHQHPTNLQNELPQQINVGGSGGGGGSTFNFSSARNATEWVPGVHSGTTTGVPGVVSSSTGGGQQVQAFGHLTTQPQQHDQNTTILYSSGAQLQHQPQHQLMNSTGQLQQNSCYSQQQHNNMSMVNTSCSNQVQMVPQLQPYVAAGSAHNSSQQHREQLHQPYGTTTHVGQASHVIVGGTNILTASMNQHPSFLINGGGQGQHQNVAQQPYRENVSGKNGMLLTTADNCYTTQMPLNNASGSCSGATPMNTNQKWQNNRGTTDQRSNKHQQRYNSSNNSRYGGSSCNNTNTMNTSGNRGHQNSCANNYVQDENMPPSDNFFQNSSYNNYNNQQQHQPPPRPSETNRPLILNKNSGMNVMKHSTMTTPMSSASPIAEQSPSDSAGEQHQAPPREQDGTSVLLPQNKHVVHMSSSGTKEKIQRKRKKARALPPQNVNAIVSQSPGSSKGKHKLAEDDAPLGTSLDTDIPAPDADVKDLLINSAGWNGDKNAADLAWQKSGGDFGDAVKLLTNWKQKGGAPSKSASAHGGKDRKVKA
ncbi:unnamed protein product [Amoebophrya sp. A120]|nr:unnamed protein product [Amoebophrya sp. A120]|eukprot:GSA120T00001889001.1